MQKTSHQLLTVVEAAARTGRKVSTWRRDILLRRIPYVKLGRSVRIPVEVVDRLIRDGWREAVDSGDVVTPLSPAHSKAPHGGVREAAMGVCEVSMRTTEGPRRRVWNPHRRRSRQAPDLV